MEKFRLAIVTEPGGKLLEKFPEECTNTPTSGEKEMVKEREGMETYKQPQFADTWSVSLNTEVLQSVRIMLNNVSDA